jgi:hypothetical protein
MPVSAYTVLKFNVHSITLIVYVLVACELPPYCATMFYFFFADLYVVEFQKRGLPHIHVLIWLKEPTRDVTGNAIDRFVSAEIPDVRTDPLGYAVVEEFMIHGPCGEFNQGCPCMKDGTCSKRYPKTFNEETVVDSLGVPVYRRRQDGHYVVKGGVRLDNRWVVPYNLALLKKFHGHLNVEWCNKSNLLKYLFMYLTKGDEIDEYVMCR